MAQVDTSIYGRQAQPDFAAPLQTLIMGQQIGQNAQRNRLTQMALEEEQGLNDAYAGAYGPNGLDQNKLLGTLASGGLGSAIPGVQKGLADQQKASTDAQLSKYKAATEQVNLVGQLVNGITDEPSFQAARQRAQALGVPLTGVPDTFDPNWVTQTQRQALTAKDQLDSWAKQQGLAVQQGQLAVSQDRLAFDKANPQVQFIDAPTGVQAGNPRTGVVAPAMGPDGKPVQGAKAAEATAKAREQSKEAVQAKLALDTSGSALDELAKAANELINEPALSAAVGMAGPLPNIPGTKAADIKARIDSIKARVGFIALQAMRDASKTGGALGSVSNDENKLLQAQIDSLDSSQSPEQFKRSLQNIINYTQGVKTRMSSAYQQQYGDAPASAGAAGAAPAGGRPSLDSIFGG